MFKLRNILLCAFLLYSNLASAVDFEIGQVWKYKTRASEDASRLTILKIDQFDGAKIVAVQITGLNIKLKNSNGVVPILQHVPISDEALSESVLSLEKQLSSLPDFEEGYKIWREAFDSGRGGYFTIPARDIVVYMEQIFNDQQ